MIIRITWTLHHKHCTTMNRVSRLPVASTSSTYGVIIRCRRHVIVTTTMGTPNARFINRAISHSDECTVINCDIASDTLRLSENNYVSVTRCTFFSHHFEFPAIISPPSLASQSEIFGVRYTRTPVLYSISGLMCAAMFSGSRTSPTVQKLLKIKNQSRARLIPELD